MWFIHSLSVSWKETPFPPKSSILHCSFDSGCPVWIFADLHCCSIWIDNICFPFTQPQKLNTQAFLKYSPFSPHFNACCYELNVCVAPEFIYWILHPGVVVFGGGVCVSWLAPEGGALMSRLSILFLETQRALPLPPCEDSARRQLFRAQEK